ncbi:MAG: DNA polymerase Y family protein [Thermomicrobiales bacterium]|nr:DNA polymerase Y family protein [Thermomicrobiales bacterium]
MAIACVHIPQFALRIAVLEQPALDGLPLVLTSASSARTVVIDCTPEAAARGIKPEMLLREVTTLCPDAVFIPSNPAREAAAFDAIVDALETFSPLVEPAELGTCHVDLRGLDRHDGSLSDAGERLRRLVSPILRPRVGIGPGKFTSWVAARQSAPGSGARIIPEAEAEAKRTLASVPTWWLPFPAALLKRLDRLGLRSLGEIAALPASAMQARFGADGRRIWELCNGNDETLIRPRGKPETLTERLPFPAPIVSREMLLIALRQLILRAFTRPQLRHRYVRQVRLQVLIEDNRSWEKEMTFREPVGRERLIETLRHRLQEVDLPGPAEGLSLELIGLVGEVAHQELIPSLRTRRTRPIVEAARQLKQRYGVSPLFHIAEVEPWSRIPERRHALISYDP